jgi:hypothetical protein
MSQNDDIIKAHKALQDADVPTDNRYMSRQDEEIIFLLDQCHLELGNAKIGPESATILGKYAERIERHYAGHNMVTNSSEPTPGHLEPPSSLHTKLQNIAKAMVFDGSANGKDTPVDPWVAQILQALKESGYRQVPKQSEIQHLIDDGSISPLETGQEWLNRFKAELDKEPKLEKYPKSRETTDKGGHYALGWNNCYDSLLERAKRAAGVSDE